MNRGPAHPPSEATAAGCPVGGPTAKEGQSSRERGKQEPSRAAGAGGLTGQVGVRQRGPRQDEAAREKPASVDAGVQARGRERPCPWSPVNAERRLVGPTASLRAQEPRGLGRKEGAALSPASWSCPAGAPLTSGLLRLFGELAQRGSKAGGRRGLGRQRAAGGGAAAGHQGAIERRGGEGVDGGGGPGRGGKHP